MKIGENINYLWKMKKYCFIFLMFCCAFTTMAQNLILNGSFEDNTASNHILQLSNSQYNDTMTASFSFGPISGTGNNGEIDLLKSGGGIYYWDTSWAVKAQEGDWFIAPWAMSYTYLSNGDTLIGSNYQDAFSLELYSTLTTGSWYTLSFYNKHKYPPNAYPFYLPGRLSVGISHYADSFGVTIDTSAYTDTAWAQQSVHFQATSNFGHITCRPVREQIGGDWAFVDNFVLRFDSTGTYVPPVGINETSQLEKQLLKIVDILGRESKSKKGLLFYIYSDGTVEKKLMIE